MGGAPTLATTLVPMGMGYSAHKLSGDIIKVNWGCN